MSEDIKLPPAIQTACDNVVSATLASKPLPIDDLKVLQEWLEIDGCDLIAN